MKTIAMMATSLVIALAGTSSSAAPPAAQSATETFLHLTTVPLWDHGAPGALGQGAEDQPTLTVFPPQDHPNGSAVIIAPGGGYGVLAGNLEGRQVADWFAARGITAFVLRYRLGPRYTMPIPLADARRAIRYVRAKAKFYDLAPDRIGMMGFSAGGHLAAMAGTAYDAGDATAADPVERASSRPDFLVLAYPALVMFEAQDQTRLGYCNLMKIARCDEAYLKTYRPDLHVTANTPPTFLYHTTQDSVVPAADSVRFYSALTRAGVSAELHIFARGEHGSGLGGGDAALDAWPALLETWLRQNKLLDPNPAPGH